MFLKFMSRFAIVTLLLSIHFCFLFANYCIYAKKVVSLQAE